MNSAHPLRIVIAGHVDHGKSTLVGRLLHETGSLPEGRYESIRAMCEKRGMPLEWAFLLDALQAERDQAVTIDTTQIHFHTEARDYVLIDAPGHKEFLKNMITGAAQAEAALLLVDAEEGVQEQTRRHGYLLHLMGIRQLAVVINKMDAVNYDRAAFEKTALAVETFLHELGLAPTAIIPASAREGDLIIAPSAKMNWYQGVPVAAALDAFTQTAEAEGLALRLPVQDIYKFDERRIIAGRIESGRVAAGDEVLFSPSGKRAKVLTIEEWPEKTRTSANAERSVGITLDEQIFIERGEVISHEHNPPVESDVFRAHIFWLGHKPLRVNEHYKVKLATTEVMARVQSVEHIINTDDLSRREAALVPRNQVGEVVLRASRTLAFDEFQNNARMGRFVLVDGYDIAGGGIISMRGYADQRRLRNLAPENITRVAHRVTAEQRHARSQHRGGVLWMTGLSGAGKSTLALLLEQKLFDKGYAVYVLDGDNIRHGLNADLGFSPADRAENIRRIGEVGALFARAGFVAIAAFISPYRSDRERARAAAENFHEAYIKADIALCEERDPKGLYKKARAGNLPAFTGISAPYEEPASPEIIIDTGALNPAQAVEKLADYVANHFALQPAIKR